MFPPFLKLGIEQLVSNYISFNIVVSFDD